MNGINPIQGFKNMSTGKKVATVAGTALLGATTAAYFAGKGKGIPTERHNKVLLSNIIAGYSCIAGKAVYGVLNGMKKGTSFVSEKAEKLANLVKGKFSK